MRDPNLNRKETLSLEEVMPFIIVAPPAETESKDLLRDIKGDLINMAAAKLQNFAENGVRCVKCQLAGTYFGKEKYATIPYYHLNLYGMRRGTEIQMMKMLTVAPAKGGLDVLSNQQTICFECHCKKVNEAPDLIARRVKRMKKRRANQAKKAAGLVKVKVGEKKPRRHTIER